MKDLPIPVFINRRQIELPASKMMAEQILQVGDYGPDYQLFVLVSEGDPSGGRFVDRSELVDVIRSMHFRAIPGNATFGAARSVASAEVINPVLDEDLQRLREQGFEYDLLVSLPEVGIVVRDVPLLGGKFSLPMTNILLKTTLLYPQSEMDMFWVEPELLLGSGGEPEATNLEVHFGQPWRRFSWHRNCPWIPGRDDLLTHLEFARARLDNPS